MVVVTVGCDDVAQSGVEVAVEVEPIPITFADSAYPSISLDDGTRATISNDATDITTMGVYSYLISENVETYVASPESYIFVDDDNIMTNRSVERTTTTADDGSTTSAWSYTPIEYWDTADNHAIYFLAYTPYSEGLLVVDDEMNEEEGNGISSYKINNHIYINYTMPTTASNQPNIMVSDPVVAKFDSSAAALQNPVGFTFNHTVASVGIKISGNSSKRVVAAGIKGLYNSGSLAIGEDANEWSGMASTSTNVYQIGLIDKPTPESDSVEPRNITADDGYLMVIPQSMNNDTQLVVAYCDASDDVDTSQYNISNNYNNTGYNITKVEYYLGGSRGWYAGYRYYYNVTLP